jgi:hypothetical protein
MNDRNTNGSASGKPQRAERQTYINNMIVEECLNFLPHGIEHPAIADYMAFLRQNLPQNSANTRLKYAEYIAYRYSINGIINQPLARFLRVCPNDRAKREVLWFETIRAMPPLRDLSENWLSKLNDSPASRQELLDFLKIRIGDRNPDKIASEAVSAIRKFGHLRSEKPGLYIAVWTEPPLEALLYVLSRLYPASTLVRMEVFKTDTLWQALLWSATGLERLVLGAERNGIIGQVTKLDNYYQFALEGSGDERLERLLKK